MATPDLQSQSVALSSSSFLDFSGYRITSASTVEAAYGFSDGQLFDNASGATGFNLALMLQRVQQPTALLSQPWASRQQQLAQLDKAGTLWSTYGADPATYASIVSQLQEAPYNFTILSSGSSNGNYVSSAESRTIWITIDSGKKFKALFGTDLYYSNSAGLAYWNGSLSLPSSWPIIGLWLDTDTVPKPSNFTPGVSATLAQGPQSPGNSTANSPQLPPQIIAESYYNFPLQGQLYPTGTIGLIEPGVGTALPGDQAGTTFAANLQSYLQLVSQQASVPVPQITVQGINGQAPNSSKERSLDTGIVSAINPNSPLVFYNGSGDADATGLANSSVFTAVQSAAWDTVNNPQVTTNSWGDSQSMSPGSPFYAAYSAIFEDAALNNQTTLIALGDGGSGNETGNGLTNVETNITQPYNLIVSGTSLSSLGSANADPTLNSSSQANWVTLALAGDRSTLWQLMQAGLSTLPSANYPQNRFLEAVWNSYDVQGTLITGDSPDWLTGFLDNSTSSGGVDPTQPAPSYQINFGLSPVTSDPLAQSGRGVPDVSANAGGNLYYSVPDGNMKVHIDSTTKQPIFYSGSGTSAATPFWASLVVQLNAIFKDQGLPQLGYMNDLLYTAAVVSPGAFNDIQNGNNKSSFYSPGVYSTPGDKKLTPTDFGYQATPGYDLVSGLGTPNGTRLAIALTNIAHAQLSTSAAPAVLEQGGSGTISSASQALQFQVSSPTAASASIKLAGATTALSGFASASYAWTAQLAQQSLQSGFDSNLVRLFDGAAQGALIQRSVSSAADVQVQLAGAATQTPQFNLSSAYGFVDFSNAGGVVRASRPVSVATTPGNQNNADVVVRMRQNGADSTALFFYKVDSLTGNIDSLLPGQAEYEAAAMSRRYQFRSGGVILQGAGHGKYVQSVLKGVNSGDLIAFGLINQTQGNTSWGFADANEQAGGQAVNHVWNYGMNVFGFEDTLGGGDRDFNDAVFELDYGSASGSGWLLTPLQAPQPSIA